MTVQANQSQSVNSVKRCLKVRGDGHLHKLC